MSPGESDAAALGKVGQVSQQSWCRSTGLERAGPRRAVLGWRLLGMRKAIGLKGAGDSGNGLSTLEFAAPVHARFTLGPGPSQ